MVGPYVAGQIGRRAKRVIPQPVHTADREVRQWLDVEMCKVLCSHFEVRGLVGPWYRRRAR